MPELNIPKMLNFGGGDLVEISYLESVLGISRRKAMKYLKALRINPMYVEDQVYFSLPTLRRVMFVLSLPGSPGFIFPGSRGTSRGYLKKSGNYISEVTDEILNKAARPEILAEMAAAEGRDPGILKKFASKPVGRPRKGE